MDKIKNFVKENGVSVISVIGLIITIILAGFLYKDKKEEEQKRIQAQNKIAEMSEVMKEDEKIWSRLSKQQKKLIKELEKKNEKLAEKIKKRDEKILVLSETIANFEPVKVIVRDENIDQSEEEGENEDGDQVIRKKVKFDQTQDPIRVSGFTLTDPPEAEINFEFIKPLELRTTVVQNEDGAWRTYFEHNWDNLNVENIETIVNPNIEKDSGGILSNIAIGTNLTINAKFDSVFVNAYGLYDMDNVSVGPAIGAGIIEGNARFMFGLGVEWRPWK